MDFTNATILASGHIEQFKQRLEAVSLTPGQMEDLHSKDISRIIS